MWILLQQAVHKVIIGFQMCSPRAPTITILTSVSKTEMQRTAKLIHKFHPSKTGPPPGAPLRQIQFAVMLMSSECKLSHSGLHSPCWFISYGVLMSCLKNSFICFMFFFYMHRVYCPYVSMLHCSLRATWLLSQYINKQELN